MEQVTIELNFIVSILVTSQWMEPINRGLLSLSKHNASRRVLSIYFESCESIGRKSNGREFGVEFLAVLMEKALELWRSGRLPYYDHNPTGNHSKLGDST